MDLPLSWVATEQEDVPEISSKASTEQFPKLFWYAKAEGCLYQLTGHVTQVSVAVRYLSRGLGVFR